MTIVLAALAAAVLGAAGPFVLRRMPEPDAPDPGKPRYAELADVPRLAPALAAGAAALAALPAWRIEHAALVPVWVLVAGVGSWLTYVDWRTRLLPFVLVAPTYVGVWLLVGLAAVLMDDRGVVVHAAVANVSVWLVFHALHWVGGRYFRGAFGYGDVRLSAVLATALGPLGTSEVLVGVYAGFVLGAVLGAVLSRLHRVDAGGYAFGPYMVAGAVLGAAYGPAVYQV